MLTREQVLDIQTYCAEHKITIGERLGELHIETSQFYRWQRKYRQEDEQSSDPGSFVQLTQGGAFVSPMMPPARTSGKSRSFIELEAYLLPWFILMFFQLCGKLADSDIQIINVATDIL